MSSISSYLIDYIFVILAIYFGPNPKKDIKNGKEENYSAGV